MKKIFSLNIFVLGLILCLASCAPKPIVWLTNYDEAVALAQEEDKRMLVFFSALEQNEGSKKLKADIFDTPNFARAVQDLVLLNIDIPSDPDSIDDQAKETIIHLLNQYSVSTNIPMVFLAGSNGLPFYNLAYDSTATEAKTFIDLLKDELKKEKDRISLRKKIDTETGVKKVLLIDELYESTDQNYKDSTLEYISQIPALDPENESGLVGKYTFIMLYPQAFLEAYMGNMDKAVQLFLDFVQNPLAQTAEIQQAYYVAAYFMSQKPDASYDEVLNLMEKAYDVDPSSAFAPEIALARDQLLAILEQESTNLEVIPQE